MDFSDRRGGKAAMSETIQVQMLGEFTIRYGDCVISDSNDRSHRVWSLLAYLLVNRRREFTQEELINLCWSGGTGSSDPANALKSVFHRIRALLDRLEDGLGHRLLLRRSGRYVWNEEVPITLDIEQFEERCRRGDREKEPEARLRAYQAAVGCYRGDLLPRLSGEIWVMPLETYYHGLYAGAVSSAIEILEDCGRTEELAALCRQAVKIEPYKEEFYEHLMCALIENGDNREAMAVYDDMSEMLFSDFGASCTGRHRARSTTILCRWTSCACSFRRRIAPAARCCANMTFSRSCTVCRRVRSHAWASPCISVCCR